jgi:hypothetical protein
MVALHRNTHFSVANIQTLILSVAHHLNTRFKGGALLKRSFYEWHTIQRRF